MNELEFELIEVSKHNTRIVYEVRRKGLEVGLLTLDEPYNAEKMKRKEMILK